MCVSDNDEIDRTKLTNLIAIVMVFIYLFIIRVIVLGMYSCFGMIWLHVFVACWQWFSYRVSETQEERKLQYCFWKTTAVNVCTLSVTLKERDVHDNLREPRKRLRGFRYKMTYKWCENHNKTHIRGRHNVRKQANGCT